MKWISWEEGNAWEICTEVQHKGKTYQKILDSLNEGEEIADYNLVQMLRNEKVHECFEDFWVFVPNPDKISKEKGYVARFYANSDWADLECSGNPSYRNASLGVFLIRRKKE